jgi:hypothetical protein
MSRNTPPLDPDAMMRSMNPATAPPSSGELEAALQRLLAEDELATATAAGRRPRIARSPRPRLALAAGVLVAVIAASFAAINLLPASSHSAGVGNALAKDVVARTAALAGGAGNGILHIDMLVTQASASTSREVHYRVQSWAQLSAPHAYWETSYAGSDVSTTVLVHGRVEYYDSASDTLSGGTKRVAGAQPRAALFDPAYHSVLAVLYPGNVTAHQLPPTFSQLVARLIRSPNVTVDSDATFDGRPAIRITALHGRAILYTQPHSYTPLEFVTVGDPGANPASIARITMRFAAYETLPHGSVSPPDLQKLHPSARRSS